jgi:hypothetical protein
MVTSDYYQMLIRPDVYYGRSHYDYYGKTSL